MGENLDFGIKSIPSMGHRRKRRLHVPSECHLVSFDFSFSLEKLQKHFVKKRKQNKSFEGTVASFLFNSKIKSRVIRKKKSILMLIRP